MSDAPLLDILSPSQLRALLAAGYVVVKAEEMEAPMAAYPTKVVIDDCIDAVAGLTDLDRGALLSRSRSRVFVWPRQAAMALAVRMAGRSTSVIGARFGRDHTTVLHAIRAVDARMIAGDAETISLIRAASAGARLLASKRLERIAEARHG